MSRLIQRSALTDALLTVLRSADRPVGDCEMPRGSAGWIGQPNAAGRSFVAYSVVTPMGTGPGTGTLADPGQDVAFSYAITSYGVSRNQAEDQADLMRLMCAGIHNLTVPQWVGTPNEYGRRIQTVVVQTYGAVQRIGETDPKYYGQTDTVSLWTSG